MKKTALALAIGALCFVTPLAHATDRPAALDATADGVMDRLMVHPENNLVSPIKIYMATWGSDTNSGLSPQEPILTLSAAEERIEEMTTNEHRNVEVRIAPGRYMNQSVRWTNTMPEHTIKFMPLNNDKVRPVFDGTGLRTMSFLP